MEQAMIKDSIEEQGVALDKINTNLLEMENIGSGEEELAVLGDQHARFREARGVFDQYKGVPQNSSHEEKQDSLTDFYKKSEMQHAK